MGGAAGEVDPARAQLDEEQDKYGLQAERLDGEEVAGQELVPMPPQEGPPGAGLPPAGGGGRHTMPLEHIADRGAPEGMAELAQFALEAAVAPAGVLPRQPEEHLLDLGGDGPATAGIVTPGGPLAADQLAGPLQHRLGADHQQAPAQTGLTPGHRAR